MAHFRRSIQIGAPVQVQVVFDLHADPRNIADR